MNKQCNGYRDIDEPSSNSGLETKVFSCTIAAIMRKDKSYKVYKPCLLSSTPDMDSIVG